MNDKDKEAFDKWWDEERGGKPLNKDHIPVTEEQLYRWENQAWQAACEYMKDKVEHRDDLIYELEQNYLVEKEKANMLLEKLEEISTGWSENYREDAKDAVRAYKEW